MQFNVFIVSLLAAALIATMLAAYVQRHYRQVHAGRGLFLMLYSIGFWSAAAALEAAVTSRIGKEIASAVSYIGIQSAPVLFFLLAARASGRTEFVRKRRLMGLFVVPVLATLAALTNPWHGWLWSRIRLVQHDILGVAAVYERGPLFWGSAFYAYLMIVSGMLVLVETSLHRPRLYRRQALMLLLSALVPLGANAAYLLQPSMNRLSDFTPLVFTISGLLMTLALLRYRLLDIMPVPSDTLVRQLEDGLIAIDARGRIVGTNPAARRLLALQQDVIGQLAADVFAPWPNLVGLIQGSKQATTQIKVRSRPARYIDSRMIPLEATDSAYAARLLRLHDVSDRIHRQQSLEKAEALQRLLLQVATDLINMPAERIDAAMRQGLAVAGRATGIDRVRVMHYDRPQSRVVETLGWLDPELPDPAGPRAPLSFASCAEWFSQHRRGRPVVIAAVSDLPGNDPMRNSLMGQGVRATVAFPLVHETDCYGFVEFALMRREKRWMQDDLKLFELLSQLISNAETRRRTEARLRQLSQAVEQSPASVVITDASGAIEYVNPRFTHVTGYKQDEVIGQNPRILKSGQQPPAVYRELWRTLISGADWRGELQNRKKNGTLFWESAAISPLRDRDGRITHYVAVKEDITLQKAALENLEILSERLSTVIRAFQGGLLLEDESRRVILSNQSFCDLFRISVSPDALVGSEAESHILASGLLAPAHAGVAFKERTAAVIERHVPVAHEELACSDGRILERDYVPVMRGAVSMGHLWIYQDATARRQAERSRIAVERQLQQNQKLESLGVMAGAIAHDFNNLIMAIMGNIELVMLDLPETDPNHESLSDAIQASRRAADLTRQMLAYAGKAHYKRETVDLNALIANMPSLIKNALRDDIVLTQQLEPDLPVVEADAGEVQQIILNLLQNASEAIGERAGRITVRTQHRPYDSQALSANRTLNHPLPGPFVCLSVRDNGEGMDEETRDRIFDPFFTTRFTGRGLGMSAVHGIVKAHQGAIFIDSALGEGSTVSVLLPLPRSNGDAPENLLEQKSRATQNGRRPEQKRRVLLVEDDKLVRNVGCKLLQLLGCEVTIAQDGQEAVDLFRQLENRFDCVLLDLSMPRMNGAKALPLLREIRPDVPILLCTGHDETDAANRVGSGLIAGIIHKPYDYATLRGALDNVTN